MGKASRRAVVTTLLTVGLLAGQSLKLFHSYRLQFELALDLIIICRSIHTVLTPIAEIMSGANSWAKGDGSKVGSTIVEIMESRT